MSFNRSISYLKQWFSRAISQNPGSKPKNPAPTKFVFEFQLDFYIETIVAPAMEPHCYSTQTCDR